MLLVKFQSPVSKNQNCYIVADKKQAILSFIKAYLVDKK
jgi:hypothetical protein